MKLVFCNPLILIFVLVLDDSLHLLGDFNGSFLFPLIAFDLRDLCHLPSRGIATLDRDSYNQLSIFLPNSLLLSVQTIIASPRDQNILFILVTTFLLNASR